MRFRKFRELAVVNELVIFLGLAFLIGLPLRATLAQKTQTTDNKADQNLKSSVRVNPVTLAMEFSLPLGSYPGRGGNALPITLNYSSKVWNMKRINSRHRTEHSTSGDYDFVVYNTTDIGAFREKIYCWMDKQFAAGRYY